MTLDQLLSFSFRDSAIRGVIAQINSSYLDLIKDQAQEEDKYPLFIQQLLGEMALALSMMASNLKIAGTLSLQIRGSEYLKSAFVEIRLPEDVSHEEDLSTPPSPFQIRGIAQFNETITMPNAIDLTQWVGPKASLAITMLPNKGQRYQGITPIEHPRLMQCLEAYYEQSEQLTTKFWFQSNPTQVAGFMLQQLPPNLKNNQPQAANDSTPLLIDWLTALTLTQTLRANELLESEPMELIYKLFHECPPLLHQQRRIEYHCSCSKDRLNQGLLSLGLKEIQSIAEEKAEVQVNCKLCNQLYLFDTKKLLKEAMEQA